MEKELQERGWLTKQEMRDAIAISQALPDLLPSGRHFRFVSSRRFLGRMGRRLAFILPNFLIVAVLAALYVHFGGLSWMTAIFYGVSPAVIALILHSCWRLSKLGMEDWLQWSLQPSVLSSPSSFERSGGALCRCGHYRDTPLRFFS